MRFSIILIIACTACLAISSTHAQGDPETWKVVLQFDNDILTGTDRGYTNGVRIGLARDLDSEKKAHNYLQRILYQVTGATFDAFWGEDRLPENSLRFSWGIGLTQLMYTPEDFTALNAPVGERPYAGWLGVEFSLSVSDSDSVGGATLSIGMTGENSYAAETQEWVHTNISNSPVFQGWDSQVPGEPTLNLHFDHKETMPLKKMMSFLDPNEAWPIEFDGYFEWGAAIGNFRTNAYLGSLIRAGYKLPNTYVTPRVQLGSYGQALFAPENTNDASFSFYGFIGLRGTAVLHDITLEGPVFSNFDSGVDIEPFVAELIVGFAARIYGFDISLSQTTRSDEFKGQIGEAHRFGSVMLRFAW